MYPSTLFVMNYFILELFSLTYIFIHSPQWWQLSVVHILHTYRLNHLGLLFTLFHKFTRKYFDPMLC